MTAFRHPMRRVRGMGPAKEGVAHWWAQKLTSVVLVPLSLWGVVSVVALVSAPYEEAAAWFRNPVNAALLLLLLWAVFYHTILGLQVIIEDYVHGAAGVISMVIIRSTFTLMGVISVLAALKIYLGV